MIDHKVQVAQDYMEVLLASGFSVEEVLKRGTEYIERYLYEKYASTTDIDLLIAQTVLQVAKNLHIDAESQQQSYRRSSSSTMPISAMEFKQMYEGMIDE